MTTATGDISFNFAGLENQTNFTSPLFTIHQGTVDIVNGSIRPADVAQIFVRWDDNSNSSIIRSKIETSMGNASSFNSELGPAIIDSNLNGYLFVVTGGIGYIRLCVNGARSDSITYVDGLSYSEGSIFELEYNTGTGDLELFLDSVSVGVGVSSAYTQNLGAAIYFDDGQDVPASFGVKSFAGDGFQPAQELFLDAVLAYGSSFSGTYTNYRSVPVGPVQITDSQDNTMTVPVTVTDNGDGSGSFVSSPIDLPNSGETLNPAVLIGDITVYLPDPESV